MNKSYTVEKGGETMHKFFKFIGIFNIFFTFIIMASMSSFLLDNNSSTALALGLASLALFLVAVILSVPFFIFIKKYGFQKNKFYGYTHISLFFSSLLALLSSTLLS